MQTDSFTRNTFRSIFSTALFLGTLLLGSANTHAADGEETRWYDVEVIIFSQTSQQYRDSEVWPVDYDLPQLETSQELLPAPGGAERKPGDMPVAFTRLDQQSLRLNAQADRIKSAPDTELLLHIGWRQPGLPEDQAVAVRVDDSMQDGGAQAAETIGQGSSDNLLMLDAEPVHRMEGTLKLVLSRYLHIYTDLIYREPREESAVALELPMEEPDLFSQAENPFAMPQQPRYQVYHLKQSRRMRSKELHYLDHPLLGMAILVTPYELKEAETASDSPQ